MPRIEFRWMRPAGAVETVPTEITPRRVDLQCSPSVSEVRLVPTMYAWGKDIMRRTAQFFSAAFCRLRGSVARIHDMISKCALMLTKKKC